MFSGGLNFASTIRLVDVSEVRRVIMLTARKNFERNLTCDIPKHVESMRKDLVLAAPRVRLRIARQTRQTRTLACHSARQNRSRSAHLSPGS